MNMMNNYDDNNKKKDNPLKLLLDIILFIKQSSPANKY